ncbi:MULTISPECIES: flagellar motor protein MotB [Flavobacterium]|uniref:Flagellar motor protein MotB n=1 Tax=Flavobacterium commune TaxID=1306519 RepID=A0A1D9P629_9FLAO|nr:MULTISPECIES: flagellar motor protein MotB [Flavobacterium]AOZ98048.1 flagellar motor protein MotB [Flavobacterium commune]
MKIPQIYFFILVSLLSYSGYSQNPKVFITERVGESYAYVNVTKTYERVAEKGYKSIDLFQKLGNAFYTDLNMGKAAKWYGELFAMTMDLDAIYYDQYAKSLYAIGENEKANYIMEQLKQKINSIKNK